MLVSLDQVDKEKKVSEHYYKRHRSERGVVVCLEDMHEDTWYGTRPPITRRRFLAFCLVG